MTLDSVFSQWANLTRVSTDTSVDPPVSTVTIDPSRNAARSPQMRGYLECDVSDTTAAHVESGVPYPFVVKFHAADTSVYSLDMKTSDDRDTAGYAGSGTDPIAPGYTKEAADDRFVPVNNTLMKLLLASDWVVGSADSFEASSSAKAIW